jgi:hypothetical protein
MTLKNVQNCDSGADSLAMSRLPRQCGILNISEPHSPPRPVMAIAFTFFIY